MQVSDCYFLAKESSKYFKSKLSLLLWQLILPLTEDLQLAVKFHKPSKCFLATTKLNHLLKNPATKSMNQESTQMGNKACTTRNQNRIKLILTPKFYRKFKGKAIH